MLLQAIKYTHNNQNCTQLCLLPLLDCDYKSTSRNLGLITDYEIPELILVIHIYQVRAFVSPGNGGIT